MYFEEGGANEKSQHNLNQVKLKPLEEQSFESRSEELDGEDSQVDNSCDTRKEGMVERQQAMDFPHKS